MATTKSAPAGRIGIDWAGLGWMLLFFWYFSGVTQTLIALSGVAGLQGLRQASMASALWLIPLLLFPARTRLLAGVIGTTLWLCSLSGFGYFLVYGQEFSQSVIFIMFESNVSEATEYLGHYFSWSIVFAAVAYGLGGWLLWRKVRPVYLPRQMTLVACLLLFGLSMGYEAVRQYIKRDDLQRAVDEFEENIEVASPWQLAVGYHQYRRQLGNMEDLLASQEQIPPLKNLVDAHVGQPSTLVLVIGESTNRQRLSLYGYSRPTTPNLDKLRGELQVFDNVVTPRPYTIEALQQVLTFADQEHPNLYLSTPSLVSMMKQAGYKTYWITNQQTMTKRNTMLTTFSKQADEQFYLNNNRDQNTTSQYDGDVLDPFAKVLADDAPRKFVVVHLLGTHMRYHYRYPEEFDHFTDRSGVPASVTDDQLPTYNSYDNAVLYNDYVVSSLIERFRATDPSGFLLYLADHGEAVFDAPDPKVLGRNEGAPTSPMYTVPFILWGSPKWQAQQQARNFTASLHRPYSSSHFIHTWADLAGLRFDEFDPSKSLVSAEFRERPLLIGNPQQPKSLIDFSLIKPKKPVDQDADLVQQEREAKDRTM
ncbi:phosphoethanolamine transferase CptA [Azotobacter beijerinckii]|uniref:Heptose-I-phosphate ethanolaminephosphotransferase n=1 Tax=Azotobacter beijerinckii TaxID=170623 RepID=A0A1I1CHJ4_9GAMM|nr:phosphoethanolamine transferase CptA [Azotobacter beijerinckii]SFB62175.1 heptose-I-phosphate ethanolaminephosphotransferase [Azotobacter beijerinckii]